MKRKNEDQISSYFGSLWVTMHTACIVLLGGLFFLLTIIGFSQMAGSNGGTTPLSVHLYLYAVPYIALSLTLIVLGVFQLLVSGHTLRIFPRVWPVYTTLGILSGLGLSIVAFGPQVQLQEISQYENLHEFLYSSAALIFTMLGLFQAAFLARRYSLRGATGWFLAHIFVAILLHMHKGQFSFFYIPFLFVVLACATSPLCWYFYRLSRA